jgi:hypothetical protein
VSPWEVRFFGLRQLYTNLQWAKTWAKARGRACRRRYVDIPAKLTGARHELCACYMGGAHQIWCG